MLATQDRPETPRCGAFCNPMSRGGSQGSPMSDFGRKNNPWGLLRGSGYPGFNPQLPNDSRVIRQVGFLSGISGIWGDPRWPRVALCNPMSSVGFSVGDMGNPWKPIVLEKYFSATKDPPRRL